MQGANWLMEKAKNKEFGEWMVVERRKKKPLENGRNLTKATKPPAKENQRCPQTQHKQGLTALNNQKFVPGPSSDQPASTPRTYPNRNTATSSNPRGNVVRILPRSLDSNSMTQPNTSCCTCINIVIETNPMFTVCNGLLHIERNAKTSGAKN